MRFSNFTNVPCFYIETWDEGHVWSFIKTIRPCPTHQRMTQKIENGEDLVIADICPGEEECKVGFHSPKYGVCIEDMLTGTCKCGDNSLEKLEEENQRLLERLITHPQELMEISSQLGAITKKVKEVKSRPLVHYVRDEGMISLKQRKEEQEATRPQAVTEETVAKKKPATKIKKKKK